jgi:hypothetical protein
MAALSIAYHGANSAVPEAIAEGFRQLPPDRAAQYHEHAYNLSPLAVQRILEQLMTSDNWPVYSPFAKEHFSRGKEEGEREGTKGGRREEAGEDILLVLKARGLDVSEAERDRITGCTDLRRLKEWIKRAVTVERAADLFA